MKPLKLMITGVAIFIAFAVQAQVSIQLNIGTAPRWAPAVAADVRYYYLPDVDAYYDIPSAAFIYMDNGVWVHRRHLPGRFAHYDLHRGRKVVIHDYRGDSPYSHYRYSERYAPKRHYDKCEYDRPDRDYYSDNNRRNYDISYRENNRYREVYNEREDRDHGRGHAYGKHKNWKD